MSIYDRIFPPKVYVLANGRQVSKKASRAPLYWILILFFTAVSVKITQFNFETLISRNGQFWVILGEMFPPEADYLPKIWTPIIDTIKMSLLGSFIGSVLCIPFAMLASTNVCKSRFVVALMRLMFSIVRTLPTLVTALIATFIFGLGTVAGTTAIAVFSFSYIGKILYEEIETVDMGSFEAMEAMGYTRTMAFIKSVFPQVFPSYLSNSLYNFEGNVRYAAVLGYVGAGGIGLILNEQLGWREYANVGMILTVLFVTVFLIENISRYLRRRLVEGSSRRTNWHFEGSVEKAYQERPKDWIGNLIITVITLALLIYSCSAMESSGTTTNGAQMALNILNGIVHPDTELLFNLTTQGVPYLLLETMCIAFMGTLVGAFISIPLSFISSNNLAPKPIAYLGRILIMAIRTVPAFVYGLMFIRVTGPGPFAGLLTMSLTSVGMVSKMYIEAIEDLDTKVLESLDAEGMSVWQKIRYGICPQLMPNLASTAIYRFDINLRDATVLGLVGAGGIGAPLIFAMNSYLWHKAGSILIGLIVLVLIVEWISTKIRVKLTRG